MVLVSSFYHHREEMSLSFWFPFGICSFIVVRTIGGREMPKKTKTFDRFNLVRRIAREMFVNGYRGDSEYLDTISVKERRYSDHADWIKTVCITASSGQNKGGNGFPMIKCELPPIL